MVLAIERLHGLRLPCQQDAFATPSQLDNHVAASPQSK
jgi:hypothetical protein